MNCKLLPDKQAAAAAAVVVAMVEGVQQCSMHWLCSWEMSCHKFKRVNVCVCVCVIAEKV